MRIALVHGPATIVGLGRGGEEERAMMVAAALQSGPAPPSATTASCGGTVRLIFLAYLFVFVLLLFLYLLLLKTLYFAYTVYQYVTFAQKNMDQMQLFDKSTAHMISDQFCAVCRFQAKMNKLPSCGKQML